MSRQEEKPSSIPYPRLRPGPGLSREQVAAHQDARLRQAVVELVAADSYGGLTVRSLSKRARISSGTFYRHFRSTDECFLAAFDQICRRVADRVLEAGSREGEPHERLRAGIERLLSDIAADSARAEFALYAAPAAGPALLPRLWTSSTRIANAFSSCLAAEEGLHLPSFLLEAMVAGLAKIGRGCLLTGVVGDDLDRVAAETADWLLSLSVGSPAGGKRLTSAALPPRARSRSTRARRTESPARTDTRGEERKMILTATLQVGRSGYHELSVSRIRREAGLSRQAFDRHFEGVDDCFLAALEDRANQLISAAARPAADSATWTEAVRRTLEPLCLAIEEDPDTARAFFVGIFAAGRTGIDCRDRIIDTTARALRTTAPEAAMPTELASEASVAAAWEIIRRHISEGGTEPPRNLMSKIAFLFLAPAIGVRSASREPRH